MEKIIQLAPLFALFAYLALPVQAGDFPWPLFLPAINGPQTADCNGDPGGEAYIDNCNVCVGGNSGNNDCLPIQKGVTH